LAVRNTQEADRPRRIVIAQADGRRIIAEFTGNWVRLSADRIIVSSVVPGGGNAMQAYQLYDLEGRLLAEGRGYVEGFSEGLSAVQLITQASYEQQYNYIDRDGRTVIPGPFLYAYPFENGQAVVAVGADWATARYGVIDKTGHFVIEPEYNYDNLNRYASQQTYFAYWEEGADMLAGVQDRNGNILVPAQYRTMEIAFDGFGLAIARTEHGEYDIISLPSGTVRRVESRPDYAYYLGDGWTKLEFYAPGGATAIIKGDQTHRFEYTNDEWIACHFLENEMFVMVYYDYGGGENRSDIFDGKAGKVILSLPEWHFSGITETGVIVFYRAVDMESYGDRRLLVLNRDLTPAFPDSAFGAHDGLTMVSWLVDDIYQVRTVFFSGLMRANGEWLVRVRTNTGD